LGLAVTKKVGPAAQRNRIKRVLREFFRLHQHELSAPMDIVIVPKRHVDAKSLGLAQVESELAPMLARVGILTPAFEADRRGEVQGGG